MSTLLSVSGLRGRGVVLQSLDLESGECVAVQGPSGAGKSVLLRAIADLDPCDGDVRLDGRSWREYEAPAWRRRICLVPAEPGWWSERVPDHFTDPATMAALAGSLGLAPQVLETPVARLSTGERQRLALARALELAPRVLLLDEPTSALDEDSRNAVASCLQDCLQKGTGIVLVTHEASLARRLARRALWVRAGQATPGDLE